MFSLIKFHNEKYAVVESKNVLKMEHKTCIVKCNGGEYLAFFVFKSDNKSYLQDLKSNKEENTYILSRKSKAENKTCLQPPCNMGSSFKSSSSFKTFPGTKRKSSHALELPKTYLSPVTDNGRLVLCKSNEKVLSSDESDDDDQQETLTLLLERNKIDISANKSSNDALHDKNPKYPLQFKTGAPVNKFSPNKSSNNSIEKCENIDIENEDNQLRSTSRKIQESQPYLEHKEGTSTFEKKLLLQKNKYMLHSTSASRIEGSENSNNILEKNRNIAITSISELKVLNSTIYKNQSSNLYEISSKPTNDSSALCIKEMAISQYMVNSADVAKTGSENRNIDIIKHTSVDNMWEQPSINKNLPLTGVSSYYSLSHDDNTSLYNISLSPESSDELNKTYTLANKVPKNKFDENNITAEVQDIQLISGIKNKNYQVKNASEGIKETHFRSEHILESSISELMSNDSTGHNHNSTSISETTAKKDNFTDLSSIHIEKSTISEYLPNSTAGTSERGLENLNNMSENTSLHIIDVPLNVTKVVVPYSKNKSKKHFCVFCQTLQCKISRHFFLKHKKENEVKRALALPIKSKERLNIIDTLRKKGDFLHNTSAKYNSGILIVSRQQQSKCKNYADDYVCCKTCKGFFSKRGLRIHISNSAASKNKRSNLIESRRLTQYMHPVANIALKSQIFPILRDDEITKAVRYDELIIKFGNKLSEKYSLEHQHDMIRANLRLLGRFKIELMKLDTNIKELKDMFKPPLFDKCIDTLRTTAHWDTNLRWFKTPAVAQNLTSLIKKCAKKQRAEFIKEENADLKSDLESFLQLWEEEIPTLINKKALEDQTNKKRDKKNNMPLMEDIQKLYLYLKELIINAMDTLMEKFCLSSWTTLVQATLIFIQVFNRKRAGEIERLTIDNFRNKELITDTIDKDILKNVSKESIKFAKQFVRITMRGKLGRTVSVLLCPMCVKAIELTMTYRFEAGITKENNYIFCKPSGTKFTKQYYRACPLLKQFSEQCGAQAPESLRGTSLRKHVATYASLLNIEDASVERLANFMGHNKDIHKNIYRMPIPVAEIACISKLLTAAIGDEEQVEDVTDDENVQDEIVQEDENWDDKINEENEGLNKENSQSPGNSFQGHETSSSSNKKRRSTSPFGKTRRCRWSDDEKKAIRVIFGDIKTLDKVPSLQQCFNAISQNSALSKRTPQQIKSWIDNQRRYT